MKNNDCSLCAELKGDKERSFWPSVAKNIMAPSRILFKSEYNVLMVTIGPILKGHCLLLPLEHYYSMATTGRTIFMDAKDLLDRVSVILKRLYGLNVLMFEHGTVDGNNCKPCSTGHAHWHVVPTNVKVEEMLIPDFEWHRIQNPYFTLENDYFLVGAVDSEYWVTWLNEPVPSQRLRFQLSKCIGKPGEWDWKKNAAIETVLSTIIDFKENEKTQVMAS